MTCIPITLCIPKRTWISCIINWMESFTRCQHLAGFIKSLILDEPFSGFDPINANMLKDEILALKDRGTSILFSTHRMETVESLCDHIALINKSKKILTAAG